MNSNKPTYSLITLLIFLLLISSSCSHSVNRQDNLCSFEELERIGEGLKDAIIAQDIERIASYLADSVTLEADDVVSKEEVIKLLKDNHSYLYIEFFDTERLQNLSENVRAEGITETGEYYMYIGKEAKSIRDYFLDAKGHISVKTEKTFPYDWPPPYGTVVYEFEGKPKGRSFFVDPIFVCTKDGWKLIYLFTEG